MTPPSSTSAPTTVEFDPGRRVLLHPLVYLQDNDDVTIGRPDLDAYVMLGTDGAAALRRLESGETPAAVAAWYEAEYGDRIDIGDFVTTLDALGFVCSADEAPAVAAPVRWRRLGVALFSVPAMIVYAVLIAWAAHTMLRHPELAPGYRNVFFTDYYALIELVFLVTAVPQLLLHEAFHVLAGRRIGIGSKLSIGRRLFYVVLETAMDGLVTVPRAKRYLPILAGMLADVVVVAILTIAADLTRNPGGALSLGGRICVAVALAVCLRIAWQFFFYLRTDVYVLLCTVLGCNDLQTTAKELLRNRANRLLRRPDRLVDESRWHRADRKAARWYSWLILAGYTTSIATFALTVVPITARMVSGIAARFQGSGDVTWAEILDSAVVVGFFALELGLLVWVVIRDRRRQPPTLST